MIETKPRPAVEETEIAYVEDSIMEFWKKQGVTPIPLNPCEDEEGFSWSEFINGLGR